MATERPPGVKWRAGIDLQWQPCVDASLERLEAGWHDADDARRPPIHVDDASKNGRVAAELRRPQLVTEDRDIPGAAL